MLHRDEAVAALDEIRSRQQQVMNAAVVPAWFWILNGALMIVMSFGVESRRPVLIGVCTTVFVLGVNASVLTVVLRARAQVRPRYLGWEGGAWTAAFVAVLVGVGLAAGFGLDAQGFRWPATAGNTVAGIGMAVGGPLLMRRLRHLMARRAAETLSGGTA
ncbi:MAG: hypothetical protein AUI14_05700 [Actinobacteria bacterium 13_2_20CM_2_71_6]|nr:MAG: hypothetical protein AUI14_05700 [Actinobacteria bacterium 13_2_20CM_2_71_6]